MIHLTIGPKYELEDAAKKYNCTWAISIQDYIDADVERPEGVPEGQHAIFKFDDLVSEEPIRYSKRDGSILRTHPPDMEDCKAILEFFRKIPDDSRVYVHCFAGVSRSTAMSLMMLADHLGPGKEDQAMVFVEKMALGGKFGIWPNDLIVKMADELLGRNGALIKACGKWKAEQNGIFDPKAVEEWLKSLQEKEKKAEERIYNPDPDGTTRSGQE